MWFDIYTWIFLKPWRCQVRSAPNFLILSDNVVTGKHSVHWLFNKSKLTCFKTPRHCNVQSCGRNHTVNTLVFIKCKYNRVILWEVPTSTKVLATLCLFYFHDHQLVKYNALLPRENRSYTYIKSKYKSPNMTAFLLTHPLIKSLYTHFCIQALVSSFYWGIIIGMIDWIVSHVSELKL